MEKEKYTKEEREEDMLQEAQEDIDPVYEDQLRGISNNIEMEKGETKIIEVQAQSVEYIKLIKNTKGYNWEIKQLSLNIDELYKLNEELLMKFGSENGN